MIKRVFTSGSPWLPALGLVLAIWVAATVGDAKRGEARGTEVGGPGGLGGPGGATEEVGAPCTSGQTTVGAVDGGDGAGRLCEGVADDDEVVHVPCSSAALVDAITAANSSPTVLGLASHCTYDLITPATATDALPTITGTVTLVGGPATVIRRAPAAGAMRILEVASTGTLRIDGIFIEGGAPAAGQSGAGIQNSGVLTLRHVTLRGHTTSTAGGGLNNTATGHATLVLTEVSNNVAGGEAAGGGISNFGSLTILESRLSRNNAPAAVGGGGGLVTHAGATTRIHQSTLDHNTTGGRGGAIFNRGATLLDRSLVELNTAADDGGGIFTQEPGRITLSQSVVRNNRPNNCFPLNTIAGCFQ